ncbi:cell envelope integrity protein TolA [Microbulbifer spongiae]|uniref:Cell envelope integrity protein TolA n=1 Tax=Microbulbifer spongiae TaxID=2944933 RepID=A0ABY9ECC5_9GAMM|nr:cell envelope integrity protein TolA [Microbulbifer sp. MI-G]WKD49144.1 cell envelope integrity protein TolA [Microbulbifer sp. MI-G]
MKTGAYPLAIVISLLLHGTLIAVIAYGWEASRRTEHKPMPQFVQARLVTVEAVTPKKKLPKKVDKIQQRAQREAQQRQQAEIERKRRAALERKKKRAAERKRQARIEAERKAREEKARQEKERKEREEKERKERLEKARQSSFDEALQEEEELLEANEGEQAVMSVAQAIQLRIESVWSRPPSARNGMRTLVQINFVPTGRVVAANILEGSGNAALDRSVLTAIRKVEVFPEVAELAREEPVVFEREVRKTMLNFIVEDLRQ